LDEEPRLAARALGLLYVAGATIGILSLLLPHSPRADLPGLYSNVGLAYLGGGGLLLAASRVRGWMIHVSLATGSVLVTRAVILSGEPVSFYAVWYIWVGLYAFYFCGRMAATAHVGFVAALYGATLVNLTPSSPVARWLTTVATLMVAGMFIDTLVRRARAQAADASANARRMAQVTELAHELAGISDVGAARRALCAGVTRVTNADRVLFWEPGGDGTELTRTAASGHGGEQPDRSVGSPAGARQALVSAAPVSTVLTADAEVSVLAPETASEPPLERLWYPVKRGPKVVAVLDLAWTHGRGLNVPVLALAKLLAAEAGLTMQRVALHAELEAIARTDELTGLPNRRAWQEQLSREMARVARSGESLAVAMLDLDYFKSYNDSHGHQTGDMLLKRVAGAWSTQLRASDLLARVGGEEFALALSGGDSGEAWAVVERLRTAMPGGQTCSAGIATWDGRELPAELLGRADQALYVAKRNGRDQSASAQDSPAAQAPIAGSA
jgi:diguanylate cyclase (GGDEF)-like protein